MTETRAQRNEKHNKNKKKKVNGAVEREWQIERERVKARERDRLTFLIKNNVDLLFLMKKKGSHGAAYCLDPLNRILQCGVIGATWAYSCEYKILY